MKRTHRLLLTTLLLAFLMSSGAVADGGDPVPTCPVSNPNCNIVVK